MISDNQHEQEIFGRALELGSAEEQRAYVRRACGNDQALAQRVEALLKAYALAGGFIPDRTEREPDEPASTGSNEGAGTVIGRYKLLQKLGEGGCGVVYMAEQQEPVRRRVALKVIKAGMDTRQVIARFEAERQALAMMDHPSIAKVLDAGATESGRPYFVMELVRGIKLTEYCDQNQLSTREREQLFIQVCQAVQHAHQKGVIHRDIKPSNILVTNNDGVPLPKIIDFGIAKATEGRLTDRTLFTAFEQFIGTPAYMSPEQAAMSNLDVDTRTDIYSLGVVLYELLTGGPPFDPKALLSAGLDEMRRTIREEEPVRPSTKLTRTRRPVRDEGSPKIKNPKSQIDPDLDCIVMKCLEKDRSRRYETANGVAVDLQRHLSGEPVVARPPSGAYRARKFVRRNKTLVAAAGIVAAALVAAAVVSTWQLVQARKARAVALHAVYVNKLSAAQSHYERGNIEAFRALLEETRSDPSRGFEWIYWQRRIHRELPAFRGHSREIYGVALSSNGSFAATAAFDGTVRVWDAQTGRQLLRFDKGNARGVAFGPGDRWLAAGIDRNGAGVVELWEIPSGRHLRTLEDANFSSLWSFALSPDGRTAAAGGLNNVIALWDTETGASREPLPSAPDELIWCIAFAPDGSKLLTVAEAGVCRLWDLKTRQMISTFLPNVGWTWGGNCGSFSPDGRRLVTAHFSGARALLWEAETRKVVHSFGEQQVAQPWCAVFSPDGDRIYTAGLDCQIHVFDAHTFSELDPLPKGHEVMITCLAISRDGRRILAGDMSGQAKLWSVATNDLPRSIAVRLWPEEPCPGFWRPLGIVHGPTVVFGANSQRGLILAPDTNFNVAVLDYGSQRELFRLRGHTTNISCLAASSDQRQFATGSLDGELRVWNASDGSLVFALPAHQGRVAAVAFSPDNRWIVTRGNIFEDSSIQLWDAGTGHPLLPPFQVPAGNTTCSGPFWNAAALAISPDQKWIASAEGGSVAIFDARAGRLRTEAGLLCHTSDVYALAWSPDSRHLATGGWGRIVRIWDVEHGGAPPLECRGHTLSVYTIAYSPDGRRILTGGWDNTARLWDVSTGRELLTLKGHTGCVFSAVYSPNGRQIITCSDDQTARIWEAASPEEIARWRREDQAHLRNWSRTSAPPK